MNKDLSKTQIDRIVTTLGDGADSYYVYMLCDSSTHQPFYIGKGKGGRVWQHEETKEELENTIKKIEDIIKNESLSDTDRNTLNKNLNILKLEKESSTTQKFDKIEELKNKERFEKVIVKWGLTEHEAFMAESSLINMYNYMHKDKPLTNEINGHMSKKEKENISHETTYRTVDEFLNNCAIEQYDVSDIKYKVEFVFIGDSWQECKDAFKDDEYAQKAAIKECARAAWSISPKAFDAICNNYSNIYLFALYKSQVVGTYSILSCPTRRCDLSDEYIEKKFPKYPIATRELEKKYTKEFLKTTLFEDAEAECKLNPALSNEDLYKVIGINGTIKNKQKAFDSWKDRVFFELEDVTLDDFSEKKLLVIPTQSKKNENEEKYVRKFNVGDIRNFKIAKKLPIKDKKDYLTKKKHNN